jgi:hypothetical protein
MKKSVLIFSTVLITFSLTAFTYMNWNTPVRAYEQPSCNSMVTFEPDIINSINNKADPNLVYNVQSRFNHTITKDHLKKAISVREIFPKHASESIGNFHSVKVSVLRDKKGETSEFGTSELLNEAQIKLLHSINYSNNIYITAYYKKQNIVTGASEEDHIVYYMTITPETEAEFTSGHDALISYLRENSKEETAFIEQDQLEPGMVNFTITKKGTIAHVNLTSTCGYKTVDEALVELITNMPEKWNPAKNSKGENVDQELVFFFGKEGC